MYLIISPIKIGIFLGAAVCILSLICKNFVFYRCGFTKRFFNIILTYETANSDDQYTP